MADATKTQKAGALGGNKGGGKKVAAISKEDFLKEAKPLVMKLGDIPLAAKPMEFKSGSFGWNITGKQTVMVGDVAVEVQIGANLTVVGSKPNKD
jgi:hypothetical protein